MTNSIEEKASRLRLIINDLGITQKRFAERLDMSAVYLNAIVNGYKDLSGNFLETFASKYGDKYNVAWLLTGNGPMLLPSPINNPNEPAPEYENLEQRVSRLEMEMKEVKLKFT